MNEIENPHDHFFQNIFSRLDVAASFFENYLPKETVNIIDLQTIELDRKSFVDKKLTFTQSDLLFKVKLKNGMKLLVYLLIEHKSFIDRWVLFQVWGYILRICEREREINKVLRKKKREDNYKKKRPKNEGIEEEYLTPIIPIILYHGKSNWSFPKKLSQLFKPNEEFMKHLRILSIFHG